VYLDHWGVIGYFIHTAGRRRSFVQRIHDGAVIDQYHVSGGTPGGTEIFYDKSRDSLDLYDPSVYGSFASCLRASGAKELTLFFLSPGNKPFGGTPGHMKKIIAERAEDQGLTATEIIVARASLFAGFKLAQPK
jgi:hypothetical protein